MFTLVRAKLKDADPFVRRAAADALGRHATADNVEPLLNLWAETPADDTHLVHTVRMALRDQLVRPGSYGPLAVLIASKPEYAARLAEVSLGVRNPDPARFCSLMRKHTRSRMGRWPSIYTMRCAMRPKNNSRT